MIASVSPLLRKQTGFGRQILAALWVASFMMGAAAPASEDNSGDTASAVEGQPPLTEQESGPQVEPQPAPVAPPALDTERVTLEQIDEVLELHPGPGPEQTASREHKALLDARTALREEQTWLSQRVKLESTTGGAEAQLEGFATALEAAMNPSYPEFPEELDALELLLAQDRRELADAKSRLEVIGSELSSLPEERLRGVNRTNELEVVLRDLDAESPGTEVDELLLRARRQNAEAELAWVKLSVASTDTLRSLIASEQAVLRVVIANLEARVAADQERATEQRRLNLEAQEEKARQAVRMAALQDPELQALAEENQTWLDERRAIESDRMEMEERTKLFEAEAKSIRGALESIKQRLGIAGTSPVIGTLIQRQQLRMPDMHKIRRTRTKVDRSMRDGQIQILELELVRSELVNLPSSAIPEQDDQESAIYFQVREELMAQRLQIINDLIADSSRYFDVLVSLDTAIQSVSLSVEAFQEFAIAEALWIPNKTLINRRDLLLIPGMIAEVSEQAPDLFEESVYKSNHRIWITLGTMGLLVVAIRLLKTRAHAARAVPMMETRFLNLVGPFSYELIVATLPAMIVLGIAWVLEAPDIESLLAYPMGSSFSELAMPMLFGVLLVRLCNADGIGRLQFGWPRAVCTAIQGAFYRYIFPAYGVVLVSGVLENYGLITGQQTGSRFVTLAGLALAIIGIQHIFHAQRGILAQRNRRGLLGKTFVRRVIHWGLIAWPTYLGLLVAIGYSVAVHAFFIRTVQTLWLVVVISIVGGSIRRLSRAETLRALIAWRKERRENPDSGLVGIGSNWRENRDQSRDFGRVVGAIGFIIGFAWIWADTIPALRHVGTTPLLGSGDSVFLSVGQAVRLLLCIVATTVMAIHLPRILQVLVFNRFKGINQGNRYALSTLLSYLVIVVGFIWGSVIAGIRWESIQWLLAAATVGLGFGLQEIFANLFAGIMLLFERPIRVGDTISIGPSTGTVSRIRIRSTTIRQWDRRELIVPNKDIITGQVVNWTLSDAMTRITLEIRVSHDADTQKVSRILAEILRSQCGVVEDPAPRAYLKQIDDSSIQYSCFAYLDGLSDRLSTSGILYEKILKRFRAEGIEIPYPKRDILIRHEGPPEGPIPHLSSPDVSPES